MTASISCVNSYSYEGIDKISYVGNEDTKISIFDEILSSSIEKHDLPNYQRYTLKEVGVLTIKDILKGKEKDLLNKLHFIQYWQIFTKQNKN